MQLGARFAKWGLSLFIFGVFTVGYPGYFVFDAIWPGYYYSPVPAGKNAWLLGQALFIAVYFAGIILMFGAVRVPQCRSRSRTTAMSNSGGHHEQ